MRIQPLLLVLAVSCTAIPDWPITDMSLDEAAAAAKADDRLLLIAFTASWDDHSRKLENDVWPDKAVRTWIVSHAVAIELDVHQDRELYDQLGVRGWPMLIFQRNGVELDRRVDIVDATSFLAWAEGVLAGRTASQRHDEEVRDLVARGKAFNLWFYASRLMQERAFDEATRVLVEAWTLARDDRIAGAEFTQRPVLGHMTELMELHPPARAAFERLLADVELRTFATDPPRSEGLREWIDLCDMLGKEVRVLTWLGQAADENGLLYGSFFTATADEEVFRIRFIVLDFLIDQRRFDDAARLYEDPIRYAQFLSMVGRLGRVVATIAYGWADDSSYLSRIPESVSENRRREVARIHAVTLAAGRVDEAGRVADLLLADDEKGLGRVALVESSLDLEAAPPHEANRWLDEAEELGADVRKIRRRLASLPVSLAN